MNARRIRLEQVAEVIACLAARLEVERHRVYSFAPVALREESDAHMKEDFAALGRAGWALVELGEASEGEPLPAACVRLVDRYNDRLAKRGQS